MSFRGEIEARCPKGCEPFTTEVWSFINGGASPELREAVMARECNMLLCPGCDAVFFPPEPYVYFEPDAELLAFVFPESFREREEFWRKKMHDDFETMRANLGKSLPLEVEPEIFFGIEDLAVLLEGEDYRGVETEVMEAVASGVGLSLYRVSRKFAREKGVPRSLPYDGAKGGRASLESLVLGLEKLLAANGRLGAYKAYLASLRSSPPEKLPPRSRDKRP